MIKSNSISVSNSLPLLPALTSYHYRFFLRRIDLPFNRKRLRGRTISPNFMKLYSLDTTWICFFNSRRRNQVEMASTKRMVEIGVEDPPSHPAVDVFDSEMADARVPPPEHLVVMVNGLMGSAAYWKFAAQQFVKRIPDEVVAHSMENSDQQDEQQQQQLELQEEQLNYIEETVLKKRKSSEQWAIRRKQQLLEKKWQLKKDKKLAFKRAEEFVKEYRSKELDFVNMKHRSKRRRSDIAVNSLSKPIFVIRIQGKSDIHPQIKKILYTLGLKRIYSGVFLRASADNLALLQKVEPFVTYGYPDLQNVRALIQKKGSLKIDKEKVPLNDNNIIEQALGKHDILCLEDIINEIYTVGPKFKEVASALWPFTLISPEDDVLQGKKNPFNKGGDTGNREDRINELLTKINA